MFTGLVEETGVVNRVEPGENSVRLWVDAQVAAQGARLGDSIAVNGCCLTVVAKRAFRRGGKTGARLAFDLLQETWDRTNLSAVKPGSAVNLERSLAAGDRLGGHFVTGHIDGTGRIRTWERRGRDHVLEIAAPAAICRYIVFKGSVAVDGISLTVAGVFRGGFRIWIIPHTFEVTALRERGVGDVVNLEADMLGKYVERFVRARR
ncbi:MAG: riboflavin synthase [Verrucomicrobia bacterium]|nr:riboflavin synthase [Verrucomicrobiota bacterium]